MRIAGRWRLWGLVLGLILLMLFSKTSAYAGVMGSLGGQWKVHSFKPLEDESTPNYYGLGIFGAFGYSVGKVWDLALFGSYSPSKLKNAEIGREDAQFIFYGLETGFRIAESIYLGLRGGQLSYNLIETSQTDEVPGQWAGVGGALVVGGILKTGRHTAFQVTLDVGMADVVSDRGGAETRQIDWLSLSLSYIFIGIDSLQVEGIFLQDWLGF